MKVDKIWLSIGALSLIGLIVVAVVMTSRSRYELIHPKIGDITEAIYGLGKVKSGRRYDVKFGVVSTITKIFVHEGDFVKAGTSLLENDSKVIFRAPFDGTVTLIAYYPGETSMPNVSVLRVEDLRDRYIEVSLEQEGALRITPGKVAKMSLETLRGQVLVGEVTALFSREDEFLAHIEVKNLDPSVLPGMTVDVSIEIGKVMGATLVPIRAVNNALVILQRPRGREKVKVELGYVDGLWAEVKSKNITSADELIVPKAVD